MLTKTEPMPSAAMSGDFIEVFDQALSTEQSERLVRRFKRSGSSVLRDGDDGVCGEMTDVIDVPISGRADWRDVETQLNLVMLKGLTTYIRRYAFALLWPVPLSSPDADGRSRPLTAEDVAAMDDEELSALARLVFAPGPMLLRQYRANMSRHSDWRCDLLSRDGSAKSLHRHLFWAIYLNQEFAEGETEFLYQHRKITPRTGSLLIAPAAFTHTHRGNRPRNGDKFIAAGWVQLQRLEKHYGG